MSMAGAPTGAQAAAPAGAGMDPQAIRELALAIWPKTSQSAVAALRRAAVDVLLQQVPGLPNCGPYSILASTFRQALSSADPQAYAACPPFEGSKVKTVIVGAEAIFNAKYVPGETSKAIYLDVDALKEAAQDPNKVSEYTPPPGSVAVNPPTPAIPPANPAPARKNAGRQQQHVNQQQVQQAAVLAPGDLPSNKELGICMMAMALYRPTGANDHLAILRCKLACLLARVPADSPYGAHTMLGTHLGDALGKHVPEAWQALPSAGSRLQRLADSCLVIEQTNAGGVAMRLDVTALEAAATTAATLEWRNAGAVPGRGRAIPLQEMANAQMGNVQAAAALPINMGLDQKGNVPAPRDDDYGLALAAAAISVWCPQRWHIAAAVLATLGQPAANASKNGGRHCSQTNFFIKEVQRVRGGAGHDINPRTLASEPYLNISNAGGAGNCVSLNVQAIAQAVVQAARNPQAAVDVANNRAAVKWPPDIQDLPVNHLHQQAQPLARHLVHVFMGGEGPEARENLLARILSQLEQIAGVSSGGGSQQLTTQVSGTLAAQVAQQHMQQLQGQAQQLYQLRSGAAPASAAVHQAAMAILTHGQQQQRLLASLSKPTVAGPGMTLGFGPQVSQMLAQYLQQGPAEAVAPILRLLQILTMIYPNAFEHTSMLRRTAAALLMLAQQGPLGPHTMPISNLAEALRAEDPAAWQLCFNNPDASPARDALTLLNGSPGFVFHQTPSFDVIVQLDIPSLQQAAVAASGTVGFTQGPGGQPVLIAQGLPPGAGPVIVQGPGRQQVLVSAAPGQQVHANQLNQINSAVNAMRPTGQQTMVGATNAPANSTLNAMAPVFVADGALATNNNNNRTSFHGAQGVPIPGTATAQTPPSATGQPGIAQHGSWGSVQNDQQQIQTATSGGSARASQALSGNVEGMPNLPAGISSYSGGAAQLDNVKAMAQASAHVSNASMTNQYATTTQRTTNQAGQQQQQQPPTTMTQSSKVTEANNSTLPVNGTAAQTAGLLSTLQNAISQAGANHETSNGLQPQSSQPDINKQDESDQAAKNKIAGGNMTAAQLQEWANAAFPGTTPLHIVRRAAVKLLSEARTGPAGLYTMDGPAMGLALQNMVPQAYKALPCSAQGKLRLKAVCDNCPVFKRIQSHHTQVTVQLNCSELQQAAKATPGGTAVISKEALSMSAAICARWKPAVHARNAAAEQMQARLCAMADVVYPSSEPLRELKLHAVHLLAGCFGRRREPDTATGRNRPLGDYSMMGPEFGNAMSKRAPAMWSSVPGSKLAKLCSEDKFLRVFVAGDNRAISLDVDALQTAAEAAGFACEQPPTQPLPQPEQKPQGVETVASAATAVVRNFKGPTIGDANSSVSTVTIGMTIPDVKPVPISPITKPSHASIFPGNATVADTQQSNVLVYPRSITPASPITGHAVAAAGATAAMQSNLLLQTATSQRSFTSGTTTPHAPIMLTSKPSTPTLPTITSGIGAARIQLNPAASNFAPSSVLSAATGSVGSTESLRTGQQAEMIPQAVSQAVPIPARPSSAASASTMNGDIRRLVDGAVQMASQSRSPGLGSNNTMHDSVQTSLPHSLGSSLSYVSGTDRGDVSSRLLSMTSMHNGVLQPPMRHGIGMTCGDDSVLDGAFQTQEAALMHLITE